MGLWANYLLDIQIQVPTTETMILPVNSPPLGEIFRDWILEQDWFLDFGDLNPQQVANKPPKYTHQLDGPGQLLWDSP